MLNFTKMHGLGNDFVIIEDWDASLFRPGFDPRPLIRHLADRRLGVGADQVIILQKPTFEASPTTRDPKVRGRMLIYNADGTTARACGNGTRCVAWLIADRGSNREEFFLESYSRQLRAQVIGLDRVTIDMGEAHILWDDLPDDARASRPPYPTNIQPIAVDVGNRHLIFFVPDVHAVDLALWGAVWEHWPYLPSPSNISVAHVDSTNEIHLRVWESGAGLTPACGSAACAVFAAALHNRLLSAGRDKTVVHQSGGDLAIALDRATGFIAMTGPVALVFDGQLNPADVASFIDLSDHSAEPHVVNF